MNLFKSVISFIIITVFSATLANASGPTIVVEDNGSEYITYLKIEDVHNIVSIVVLSDYSINGVAAEKAYNIPGSSLSITGINWAEIEKLDESIDYANYVVKVLDRNGNISEYPMVKFTLTDGVLNH